MPFSVLRLPSGHDKTWGLIQLYEVSGSRGARHRKRPVLPSSPRTRGTPPSGSPWGIQPSALGAPSASGRAAPFFPPRGLASGLRDAGDFARNQFLLPALESLPRGRDDWQPRQPITLLTPCEAVHGQPAPPNSSALTQVCAHAHTRIAHTCRHILTRHWPVHTHAHTCTEGLHRRTAGQDPVSTAAGLRAQGSITPSQLQSWAADPRE